MAIRVSACSLAGCLFLLAAALSPGRADDPARQQNLNAGYFLLHKILEDEEGLPFLLDVKTSPKELEDFANTISRRAKDDEAAMDRMRQADPAMRWDRNPLPKFEQDVRKSISAEKAHQLLFGSKGPEFARAFLVSQAEATKYTANLAKILAAEAPTRERQRDFSRMSARWQALYEQTFRLLRNY